MSVRKREWTTNKGQPREAWIVDYVDQHGSRRLKTFRLKKEADAFSATSTVEVRDGTHVADSASVTVSEAGEFWLKSADEAGLERTTVEQYRQHLRLHINPFLGRTLLSKISVPTVKHFDDNLREAGRSPTLRRYVIRSLGAILADSQERGLVVRNAVRDLRAKRRRGADNPHDARGSRLKIGVDIPTPTEIKAVVAALEGSRWRPLLLTAIFTGMRASELRGLTWADVDLTSAEIHVRQRADRYRKIGKLKTAAGERTIPVPPVIVQTLREWKLACPKGELELVFPNGEGNVEFHVNIIQRGLIPTMIAAGITGVTLDEKGETVATAKYAGLHALRHFYASWCINRKADGGLDLPAKTVQHRMGHSSITVTLDTYGHLFPRSDDGAELAEAERALLG